MMEEFIVKARPRLRRFHQAKWDEALIFALGSPGERGILVPTVEPEVAMAVEGRLNVPGALTRVNPPLLPEIAQMQVLRHYLRLSQETLGVDLNVDIGQGTCTIKYSPKVNDTFVRSTKIADVHPLQDPSTIQGVLEVHSRLEEMFKSISGLDRFSFQPGGGSAAIYTNIRMMQAYHASRGEAEQRDEVITTIFSHPSNAACARTCGYRVITLYPDADGYPSVEALAGAVSERTAALLITNPEDIGVFNPRIAEFVRLTHEVGGLAIYDQANANGLLGISRAREAGFDMCQFNLHKSFAAPHASGGPAAGACGVTDSLAPFLPRPTVEFDGSNYFLDNDRPQSIGKVRPFYGVTANILRAYAWIMTLGAQGLRQVSETAVLNNNYMMQRMLEIPGVTAPYALGGRRVEQVRYSWEQLTAETGVNSSQIGDRAADFGVHYWTSHHPYVVAEPATLEPSESFSKTDIDEYVDIMRHIAEEARVEPDLVRSAPHASTIHQIDHEAMGDPESWAMTWRAYRRKYLGHEVSEPPPWQPGADVPTSSVREKVRHR